MRSIVWTAAVVIGLSSAAAAQEAVYGSFGAPQPACTSCQGTGMGAPACGAPFYGTPGCCECPPGPCDNAWDGYCEKKACWQAIWHQVGTGAFGHRRYGRCGMHGCVVPAASCGGCAAPGVAQPESPTQMSPAPTPTPAPVVAPVAEQTIRWRSMPWMR